jgi:hypothetical protein
LELFLQITEFASAVIWVLDILMSDLQVAAGALQNQVDKIGYGA